MGNGTSPPGSRRASPKSLSTLSHAGTRDPAPLLLRGSALAGAVRAALAVAAPVGAGDAAAECATRAAALVLVLLCVGVTGAKRGAAGPAAAAVRAGAFDMREGSSLKSALDGPCARKGQAGWDLAAMTDPLHGPNAAVPAHMLLCIVAWGFRRTVLYARDRLPHFASRQWLHRPSPPQPPPSLAQRGGRQRLIVCAATAVKPPPPSEPRGRARGLLHPAPALLLAARQWRMKVTWAGSRQLHMTTMHLEGAHIYMPARRPA